LFIPVTGKAAGDREVNPLLHGRGLVVADRPRRPAAARTENYEIAAYEGLRRMAKALGEERAVELLDANLAQEKEALREVEKIATRVSKESFAAATV
jgi:ferritin-like metal-binding protein YciE